MLLKEIQRARAIQRVRGQGDGATCSRHQALDLCRDELSAVVTMSPLVNEYERGTAGFRSQPAAVAMEANRWTSPLYRPWHQARKSTLTHAHKWHDARVRAALAENASVAMLPPVRDVDQTASINTAVPQCNTYHERERHQASVIRSYCAVKLGPRARARGEEDVCRVAKQGIAIGASYR